MLSITSAIALLSNQTQGVLGVAAMGHTDNLTLRSMSLIAPSKTLFILAKAYNRLRRRSKATFLLFASSLVTTDFLGHVIPGAMVLHLYQNSMVFFGLCPLFLGCAMAAERCLGVTRPLFHARLVSTARTKIAVVLIWMAALVVALLPIAKLGEYTYQYPSTWCFIKVLGNTSGSDVAFMLLFSSLGLASLTVSLVCNTVSGISLVLARLRKRKCHHRAAKSHDIEMVVQLVGITVTSCICWSPLLIFGMMSVTHSFSHSTENSKHYEALMKVGVHLATCNQILDPWVYILLRRAVLRKIYRLTTGRMDMRGSTFRRWEISSFLSSEKTAVNRI
uniref:Thromboxane A2 receptor n=1 Tax=Electrophorus electricus TaxID=8005 RepID=A0AAY5EP81_ELEEL